MPLREYQQDAVHKLRAAISATAARSTACPPAAARRWWPGR